MKQYDYILFDWDGCLAKTLEVWLESYRTILQGRGITATDAEISPHLGDWSIGKQFGIEDFEMFNVETVERARSNLRFVELYDGAKDVLDELKKTKRLALVSSGSRDIIEYGLQHNGLSGIFDTIVTGEDVVNHKPHPEALETALRALSGTKEKTIMIGDSSKDLGAAVNFGIDSVLIYPESHELFYDLKTLQNIQPTYTIRGFNELISTIS